MDGGGVDFCHSVGIILSRFLARSLHPMRKTHLTNYQTARRASHKPTKARASSSLRPWCSFYKPFPSSLFGRRASLLNQYRYPSIAIIWKPVSLVKMERSRLCGVRNLSWVPSLPRVGKTTSVHVEALPVSRAVARNDFEWRARTTSLLFNVTLRKRESLVSYCG